VPKQVRPKNKSGFTLIEFLLVVVIFGVILSVVLPRALRASREAKFSQVRQYATEIAGYTVQWAQKQTEAQRENSPYTVKGFLMETVDPGLAGFASSPPVGHYTGHESFDGVERLVAPEKLPTNPFNEVSYFQKVNDDAAVPSPKPGLLYLTSAPDPSNPNYRYFYLLYTDVPTGGPGRWHGQMDHQNADGLRHGVFVTRVPDSRISPEAPSARTR